MASSLEIWSQFWTFQRSFTSCKKSSVVEQLSKNNLKLKSLRLVGLEQAITTNGLAALTDALRHNTTVEQVTICVPFLRQYYRGWMGHHDNDDPLMILFRTIGALPQLTKLCLEGNEDSKVFPVAVLTELLQQSAATSSSSSSATGLHDISCHYLDLVAYHPKEMELFGKSLEQLKNLQRVVMVNIHVLTTATIITAATGSNNHHHPLDLLAPVVRALHQCPHVELGTRVSWVPSGNTTFTSGTATKALQQLLSFTGSKVQKLALRRRIPLDCERHVLPIFDCLGHPLCILQELQLEKVHLIHLQEEFWKQMVNMLQANRSLQVLDITFVATTAAATTAAANHTTDDSSTTTTPGRILDANATNALTQALRSNSALKRLCLRDGRGEVAAAVVRNDNLINTQQLQRGAEATKSATTTTCLRRERMIMWLNLLENYNHTLEELELDVFENGFITDSNENDIHRKIRFYLQMNRKAIKMKRTAVDKTNHTNWKLRALLCTCNGTLPPELILPCLEAAMEIRDDDGEQDGDYMYECDDEDDENLANLGGHGKHHCRHHRRQHGNVSGLFYLLSQQPSIVVLLQDRICGNNENSTKKSKSYDKDSNDDFDTNAVTSKTKEMAGVTSPQLILLDDNIVALW